MIVKSWIILFDTKVIQTMSVIPFTLLSKVQLVLKLMMKNKVTGEIVMDDTGCD